MEHKNTNYEFISTVRGLINTAIFYIAFNFGNIRRLDINNKSIYLWQNIKGEVCYCFSIFEREPNTTSVTRLGNVLSSYFECQIEVVNNEKEHFKKVIAATVGLTKAFSASEQQNHYQGMYQPDPSYVEPTIDEINILLSQGNEQSQLQSGNILVPQQHTEKPLPNTSALHEGVIKLSTYYLESHINTVYIKVNELPIVHEDIYAPNKKLTCFKDNKDLNYKNIYTPTEYMVNHYYCYDPEQSFIIRFIFFMANNNIDQALKILAWIADSFTSLDKLPFALVLYSKDDSYMKLFYDEIVELLLNSDECEQVENDNLDKKSLSDKLNQKIVYNFHNITAPIILGEPAHELTNRLIYKDKYKLNNKVITTVANILITSTTKYIPMISKDVPTAIVNVNSKLDDLCNDLNIKAKKHEIAAYIKKDLGNFVGIIRCIDLDKLCNECQVVDYNIHDVYTDVLDGDVDALEVFDRIIRDKDMVPFNSAVTSKKEEKLVDELEDNFNQNKVDKSYLIDYFKILFGKSIYTSNRALIADLRKYHSTTNEPFDNLRTHVREGRGYYFLLGSDSQ